MISVSYNRTREDVTILVRCFGTDRDRFRSKLIKRIEVKWERYLPVLARVDLEADRDVLISAFGVEHAYMVGISCGEKQDIEGAYNLCLPMLKDYYLKRQ